MRTTLLVVCAFAAAGAFAQTSPEPAPPPPVSVVGAIDLHVHANPDVLDVARLAREKGLRGIVLKNHVSETASRAALVMRVVPDIEVWGGVVLNKAVGGVNPDAVEWMHRTHGARGKFVWLPTVESDKHVRTLTKPDARGLVVAPGGRITPEMEAILKIIARDNLVLATGHVHPDEIIAVVRRARELGIRSILVNRGLDNIPGLTLAQGKQLAEMGAMIEIAWTQVNAKTVAQAIKTIGAQHLVISSDALETAIGDLRAEGISDADIDVMLRKNPARLLGLAN